MAIIAKKITEQTAEHFAPNGQSLGFLTALENVDLRCQIKAHKVEGYYIIFNGVKVEIDKDGGMSHPKGLYNQMDEYFKELFGF